MKIHIPDTMAEYEPELRMFVDFMVVKLNVNRDKGFGEGKTVDFMIERMMEEIEELSTAWQNGNQVDVAMEAADVANFAFLAALVALRQTRREFEAARGNPKTERFA